MKVDEGILKKDLLQLLREMELAHPINQGD